MYNTCFTEDHTVSGATKHEPYLLSAVEHHRHLTDIHSQYVQRNGQAELTWLHRPTQINCAHKKLKPDTITHPSTNRARCGTTKFTKTNCHPQYI